MTAILALLYLLIIPHADLLNTSHNSRDRVRGTFFTGTPIYYDIPTRVIPFQR
ncbi:hypothetical protein [Rhodopirellula sallentina]|uniref:Uncharacterized protein n=1 Tax=Rhodopirellula sallentina SM41 TaxID=1263870 RepID=M5UEX0_9BACT|nr:hypothetical protein [Rhodopirellula sallentina]EMI54543.1 hypothetical protein RSSM_04014 [Rhodopirellula sallentina SM41]